jgi:hypothetical protein
MIGIPGLASVVMLDASSLAVRVPLLLLAVSPLSIGVSSWPTIFSRRVLPHHLPWTPIPRLPMPPARRGRAPCHADQPAPHPSPG